MDDSHNSPSDDLPGIENPSKIDFAGVGDDGRVTLGISDHLDWSDTAAHIEAIRAKVNAYQAFTAMPEFKEHFPGASAEPPRIVLVCASELSPEGLDFLRGAAEKMAKRGWLLEWQHVPSRI